MKAGHIEKLIVLGCVFLGLYVFYSYNMARFLVQFGDAAGFVDLIRSTSHGEGMVSPVFSSIYPLMPLLAASAAKYCSASLHNTMQYASFSTWHPYLIVYLLKPFSFIPGVTPFSIAAAINAVNLTLGLTAVYLYLRAHLAAIVPSLLFVFAIITFPLWMGDVNGQYYYDRLFFFPGLVLIFCMVGQWRNNKAWFCISCITFLISILISERIAIICSTLALTYWVIETRLNFKNKNVVWLVLGLLGLTYSFVYMRYFQNSIYYSSISFAQAVANLKSSLLPGGPLFIPTMQWAVVIAPFLILALYRLKYAVLVLIAIAPNLILSIGGAEKTGFTTHYHSAYLPILLGLATINFSELFFRMRHKNTMLSSVAIFLLFYGLFVYVGAPGKTIAMKNWKEIKSEYKRLFPGSDERKALEERSKYMLHLASYVPKNASVSTIEELMPAMVFNGNKLINFLPIGIGTSDCVFAIYDGATERLMAPSQLGSDTKDAISNCIQSKIEKTYTLVANERNYGMRYALYCHRSFLKGM